MDIVKARCVETWITISGYNQVRQRSKRPETEQRARSGPQASHSDGGCHDLVDVSARMTLWRLCCIASAAQCFHGARKTNSKRGVPVEYESSERKVRCAISWHLCLPGSRDEERTAESRGEDEWVVTMCQSLGRRFLQKCPVRRFRCRITSP